MSAPVEDKGYGVRHEVPVKRRVRCKRTLKHKAARKKAKRGVEGVTLF